MVKEKKYKATKRNDKESTFFIVLGAFLYALNYL